MINDDQISAIGEYQVAARSSAAIVGLFAFLKEHMSEKDGFVYFNQDHTRQSVWRSIALAEDLICYEHAAAISEADEA